MTVYQLKMSLVEEGTGREVSNHMARIHSNDLEAGRFSAELRIREFYRDLACDLGMDYRALDHIGIGRYWPRLPGDISREEYEAQLAAD